MMTRKDIEEQNPLDTILQVFDRIEALEEENRQLNISLVLTQIALMLVFGIAMLSMGDALSASVIGIAGLYFGFKRLKQLDQGSKDQV